MQRAKKKNAPHLPKAAPEPEQEQEAEGMDAATARCEQLQAELAERDALHQQQLAMAEAKLATNVLDADEQAQEARAEICRLRAEIDGLAAGHVAHMEEAEEKFAASQRDADEQLQGLQAKLEKAIADGLAELDKAKAEHQDALDVVGSQISRLIKERDSLQQRSSTRR